MRNIRKRESRNLDDSIGYHLGRAFRRMNRAISSALRGQSLSAVQGNILLTLWARGPLPVGELQRGVGLSSSAFTGAIDRMEEAGLLRRVPSETDRRSFLIEPANWSGPRRDEVLSSLIAAEDEFLSALGKRERAQLLALLRKLGGDD
jgi:DNA-binding MarR family transcriptional regulator